MNLSALDAAKYINEHLGLGLNINNKYETLEEKKRYNALLNEYETKRQKKKFFEKKINKTFQLLCDYLHLLKHYKELKDINDERYIEALQNINKIEFYLDEYFINGTDEDQKWFLKTNGEVVSKYARRLE